MNPPDARDRSPFVLSGRVLVVDDEEPLRTMLTELLAGKGCDCRAVANAQQARSLLADTCFDLVLADVNMPGESGIELVRHVLAEYPDTAAVMVTGLDDPAIAYAALELGAYGYILKPFRLNELLINVGNALRRRALEIDNRRHQRDLEARVRGRTAELEQVVERLELADGELRLSREETIQRLARAAEFRDNETVGHIQRMSRYCQVLAQRLGQAPEWCELLRMASTLHDVGKIGIPDQILMKPGRLTPEEFDVMKRHTEIGYQILSGSQSELLNLAATIALTHQEKVDGTGYPRRLRGAEIPLEGRIAAIADVFDALTSRRVYKEAMPLEAALGIMRDGRGTHFEEEIFDVFLASLDAVLGIKATYADETIRRLEGAR